ncbi:hypothetical protein ARMSODRAFT_1089760 [Armillaria solidipes]|uniref:Heterokaryon incompatibility domain-containing protein n=1 Tax=Armillaria solidipes TaxID=1076256 RepID=A0A2H3ARN1_9AGAR|nr:hypothetical protein ARMSODRAFT_1089760 [Armillaria solidipes]
MENSPERITDRLPLSRMKSIHVTSNSDVNIDRASPSDSEEEILHQNIDSIADDGSLISEEIPDLSQSSVLHEEISLTSSDDSMLSNDSEEEILHQNIVHISDDGGLTVHEVISFTSSDEYTSSNDSEEEILHQNINSIADDGSLISEEIPDLSQSSVLHEEISFTSSDEYTEYSSSNYSEEEILHQNIDCISDDGSSISEGIPLRELHRGTSFASSDDSEEDIIPPKSPFLPSLKPAKRKRPLRFQINGVLDKIRDTLGTPHTLDARSLSSVLEDYISKNYDFGTAYGRLRQVWNRNDDSSIQEELLRHEEMDREMRQKALGRNRIVTPHLPPRRVWDLCSNRVVPWWAVGVWPQPISHAWVDEKDCVDAWTPINGKEWPVPIPKGASLEQIRIEMLNLSGVEYTWLDVLCLRQKGGPREDLRTEEWKLDVPTIGRVYYTARVMIYLCGLGRPLRLKEGDLDSDRFWLRRSWTLQEVGIQPCIAGDTAGPGRPISQRLLSGNNVDDLLIRIYKQVEEVQSLREHDNVFSALEKMRHWVSTNPVDRVAGLTFALRPEMIPMYHESASLEDAWTALVNAMEPHSRLLFLFLYPKAGLGCKKWIPTWAQVMSEPLPGYTLRYAGRVGHNEETDKDWYAGPCIRQGLVRGLDAALPTGGYHRRGELVVEDRYRMARTFAIDAHHQCPIPEDTYVLLGLDEPSFRPSAFCWVIGRELPDRRFEKVSVFRIDSSRDTGLGSLVECMSYHILV